MPFHIATGDVELDHRLTRIVRYHQGRRAEIVLASLMVAVGVSLLWPGQTFSLPSFRVIAGLLSEAQAGLISCGFGLLRLWALWMNGRRTMPLFRGLGCVVGFVFWVGWVWGFSHTVPPVVPLFPMSAVLAVSELMTIGLITRDAYASNSLHLRKGRPKGDGL
jgi:hypothetical protein